LPGLLERTSHSLAVLLSDREPSVVMEREGGGPAQTPAEGKRIGRPPRVVDLEELRRLRAQGLSIRNIARVMRVPPSTIAKRLKLINDSARPETALQETRDGA
jgi:DNA invertase Pin-like site-specific DNA recombinase